mmetsp:Transcript_26082/g.54743  ORF Transcript_26082/g.54743 Transcript_26082/m.54743 type:complete len:297 (+) Transcript_26082:31-921(+)
MYGGGDYDAGGFGGGDQFGNDFMANADAFGGNQFQASQAVGGGGGFDMSSSQTDGKPRGTNRQSLIPVTIKQLKNAPASAAGDQNFTIDGQDLHQITVVGMIMRAEEQSTNLQYHLDDGTDDIIVKMWIDIDTDEAMVERRAAWKEGKIVRVIGQLRIFNHVRSIVAFNISPITDPNEYTFHFIECVHTHLRHSKGQPPAAGGMPTGGVPAGVPNQHPHGQPAQTANGGASLNDTVLAFFNQFGSGSDIGCTVEQCFNAMKASGANPAQIRDAVDFLVNEGHLYSTIDDDHYKGTA